MVSERDVINTQRLALWCTRSMCSLSGCFLCLWPPPLHTHSPFTFSSGFPLKGTHVLQKGRHKHTLVSASPLFSTFFAQSKSRCRQYLTHAPLIWLLWNNCLPTHAHAHTLLSVMTVWRLLHNALQIAANKFTHTPQCISLVGKKACLKVNWWSCRLSVTYKTPTLSTTASYLIHTFEAHYQKALPRFGAKEITCTWSSSYTHFSCPKKSISLLLCSESVVIALVAISFTGDHQSSTVR